MLRLSNLDEVAAAWFSTAGAGNPSDSQVDKFPI